MISSSLAIIIILISSFIVAISQCILKSSANKKHKGIIWEYLNFRVIFGYGLFMIALLLNVFAYQGIPYKLGPIIASTSYIFIMILSALFLEEKITKKKVFGNALILLGIIIFAN
ncbi:MAG: EamA family transporter [Clostridium sp.]|uniref:EamA family transporter n=1 Tax=Clostridium sp. TaxID=1506 RepID=UPI0025BD8178|nr:EamA family transporter [Clostridium sp.]MCF0147282.1 EamA family transporter [Clostridium sp.]